MNKKRMLSLLLTLILTLTAGAAAAIGISGEAQPDQWLSQEIETMYIDMATVIDGIYYNYAEVSPLDAFDVFMNAHPGAKITEVKFETKKDELQYKVEGYDDSSKYELRVNAVSGEVISDKTKSLDKKHKEDGIITGEDIAKVNGLVVKAMEETGGNLKFKKWSLEDEDGILEFEIEFKNEKGKDIEYTYNLRTGELIEIDD